MVVMSADRGDESVARCLGKYISLLIVFLELGALNYLVKPIRLADIIAWKGRLIQKRCDNLKKEHSRSDT